MATVIMLFVSPSSSSSSTPVTVTVCAVFQLPVVKVSEEVTVASAVFSLVIVKTTSPLGSVFSTTVKVSVVPDSFKLVEPPDSVIV